MKKTNILIFGGNGLLGKALIERLLKNKSFFIFSFDKLHNENKSKNNAKRIVYIKENINSISKVKLNNLISKVDIIYFKIGKLGDPKISIDIHQLWDFIETNALSFLKVIKSSQISNLKRIIVDSSITSINDLNRNGPLNENINPQTPANFYGLSKALLEDICNFYSKKLKKKIILIRYPRIYSPQQINFLEIFYNKVIRDEEVSIYGNPNKKIDLVHINDAIEFTYKCISYNGKKNLFHVCYNEPISLIKIANLISLKAKKTRLRIIQESKFRLPRESDNASLLDSYSSRNINILFKYNLIKIIEDVFKKNNSS